MAAASFDLGPVSRITVGAVGVPGQRIFYLQARQGRSLVTLVVEKAQVQALAERVLEVLPASPAAAAPDAEAVELEEPVQPAWRAGELELGYEAGRDLCVLVARELVEEEEGEGATARFGTTGQQMRLLARHALEVCRAGRPICALCGRPKDPQSHFCPPSNGWKSA